MKYNYTELIKLANELSLEDLLFIMQINQDRIFVHVNHNEVSYCQDLDKKVPMCLNGTSIQINIESIQEIKKC
tara:strand:- start:1205 stop:1423 length:219 start_codon:yes stop_codon:yes gene_type:complete